MKTANENNNHDLDEEPQMRSTLQLTSKTVLDKQQIRKARIIIKSLCEHNEAYDFKTPVDWKGMNLTDYPLIVKNPMDLGTVEKLLNSSKIHNVEQFLDHVQLIWDNCKIYNQAGSWIYQSAEKIERVFKKMIRNYFPDISIIVPQSTLVTNIELNQGPKNEKNSSMYDNVSDEEITYYEKLNLSEKIQKLDEGQLKQFISYLSSEFPETLKEVVQSTMVDQLGEVKQNPDRIQILVDNFSISTFRQTNQFINSLLEQKDEKPFGVKKIKNI